MIRRTIAAVLAATTLAGAFAASASADVVVGGVHLDSHPATASGGPDSATTSSSRPRVVIKGRCGVHMGRVVQRNQSGTVYHVRIGPKHSGGRLHCRGGYARRVHGAALGDVWSWHPFDLPAWNWRGIADVAANTAITAGACTAAGAAFAGTFPSGAATTVIAVGMGAGCIRGVVTLGGQVTSTNYGFRR